MHYFQICTELWPNQESENLYFVLANLVVCYLFPLAVISACYVQIWRRVALRRMPGEVCGQIIINRSKVKVRGNDGKTTKHAYRTKSRPST